MLEVIAFPGSSLRIDALMQGFAKKYCADNNLTKGEDCIYVCAFGLLMVNTDMHNPLVKTKLSKERFTRDIMSSITASMNGIPSEFITSSDVRVLPSTTIHNILTSHPSH